MLTKKKFEEIEYTDKSYEDELTRIQEKFLPLVQIFKKNNTAMRIGTNHGSLSDRILSRYGDTPKGMVESAMEFLRICQEQDFHNIILSMKASNTRVMVQAYRMLVYEMIKENMNYPIHLGVTEAGEAEDGRIKSAVGIGSLLADGIGDTIRVSLTEPPEEEIPVAEKLLANFDDIENHSHIKEIKKYPINPFEYKRRKTKTILNIGGSNVPIIKADFSLKQKITPASLFSLGYSYSVPLDKWHISDMAADYLYVGDHELDFEVPGTLGVIYNYNSWKKHKKGYPCMDAKEYINSKEKSSVLNFIYVCLTELTEKIKNKLKSDDTAVIVIDTFNKNGMAEQRKLFVDLMNEKIDCPVVIRRIIQKLIL